MNETQRRPGLPAPTADPHPALQLAVNLAGKAGILTSLLDPQFPRPAGAATQGGCGAARTLTAEEKYALLVPFAALAQSLSTWAAILADDTAFAGLPGRRLDTACRRFGEARDQIQRVIPPPAAQAGTASATHHRRLP